MRVRSWFFGAVVAPVALALSASGSAQAAAPSSPSSPHADAAPSEAALHAARELFRQAMAAQDAGDWAGSLAKLRRVADVRATPTVLFYIAYNEEKLGQLVLALAHMTDAVKGLEATAADKRSPQNADAAKLLPFAHDELTKLDAHVPHLRIVLSPPPPPGGAAASFTLTVDGAPVLSEAWSHLAVAAGPHHVIVQAPGYQDARVETTAREDAVVDVPVPLTKLVVVAPPPVMAAAVPALESDTSSTQRGHGAAVATTAGAGVLLGGGIASFFVAAHDASTARDSCAQATTQAACTSATPRSAIRTFDALALGGFIGAAGLGALSIVLWSRPSSSAPAAAGASLGIGPGRASFGATF